MHILGHTERTSCANLRASRDRHLSSVPPLILACSSAIRAVCPVPEGEVSLSRTHTGANDAPPCVCEGSVLSFFC